MKVSGVSSIHTVNPVFKGNTIVKNDVENKFKTNGTFKGQPIKRPMFK